MLHQCRAHSPYQVQFSCHCFQPLRSPRPLISGTSITGMATAFCPAIISRPTTAFQFMVRRDQRGTPDYAPTYWYNGGWYYFHDPGFFHGRYNGGSFGPCWTWTPIGLMWNCG